MRSFSTRNIGDFTPRPLAYCGMFFLNLPISVDNFKSPSYNPCFSVAPLIIFTKVLRWREAVGFDCNMYLDSRYSAVKFHALIKYVLLPMVSVSVEPFFSPPPSPRVAAPVQQPLRPVMTRISRLRCCCLVWRAKTVLLLKEEFRLRTKPHLWRCSLVEWASHPCVRWAEVTRLC
jgi:hypothetical protein